jgi:hypothetical protein
MWLLDMSGLPRFSWAADNYRASGLEILAAAVVWAPIVQWLGATTTLPSQKRLRLGMSGFRLLFHALVTFVLALFTGRGLVRLADLTSTGVAVLAMVLLTLIVQIAYWFALRWRFSRRDLVGKE